MKVNVGQLNEGLHKVIIQGMDKGVKVPDHGIFLGPIEVELKIDKRSIDMNIDGKTKSIAELVCDLCLITFHKEVSTKFNLFYTSKSNETDSPGVRFWKQADPFIDISGDVRDSLLLTVPIKALCKDDCKGLCTSCGTNLNESSCGCDNDATDSRWEQLRKIQFDKSENTYRSFN